MEGGDDRGVDIAAIQTLKGGQRKGERGTEKKCITLQVEEGKGLTSQPTVTPVIFEPATLSLYFTTPTRTIVLENKDNDLEADRG